MHQATKSKSEQKTCQAAMKRKRTLTVVEKTEFIIIICGEGQEPWHSQQLQWKVTAAQLAGTWCGVSTVVVAACKDLCFRMSFVLRKST